VGRAIELNVGSTLKAILSIGFQSVVGVPALLSGYASNEVGYSRISAEMVRFVAV